MSWNKKVLCYCETLVKQYENAHVSIARLFARKPRGWSESLRDKIVNASGRTRLYGITLMEARTDRIFRIKVDAGPVNSIREISGV